MSILRAKTKLDEDHYSLAELQVFYKPCQYYTKINLKKSINKLSKEQLEKLYCPCSTCLVNAACKEHCIIVFKYMNYIADHIGYMTADEIHIYRHVVPNNVRKKIEYLYKTNSRLAHPKL